MQRATCTGLRIRSPTDARIIFHAVQSNVLPLVTRRLDNEERGLISPGCVYVWEERSPHAELTGVGIERWTDGIRWGPSRVREGFLFYHEKSDTHCHLYAGGAYGSSSNHDSILIKQTYTVFVDTPAGQRKWHLIAYFTEESIDRLKSVDDFPRLASISVPPGRYKSARTAKNKPNHNFNEESDNLQFPRLEYVPYTPSGMEAYSPVPSRAIQRPSVHVSLDNGYPKVASVSRGSSSSTSDDDEPPGVLAPLAYLENMAPLRRHPIDEKTLKLLSPCI